MILSSSLGIFITSKQIYIQNLTVEELSSLSILKLQGKLNDSEAKSIIDIVNNLLDKKSQRIHHFLMIVQPKKGCFE